MTHWLLVCSAENFETSRSRGFDLAGIKTRWKKAAGEVQPGDSVLFYITGLQVIAGETRVTASAYFDDSTEIWACSKPGERYPWRFATEPVIVLASEKYLSVRDFIDRYEYARKWPANRWTLAFQGNVHRIPAADYQLIHDLLAAKR